MLVPALMVLGPLLATTRSAEVLTVVVAVELLLASVGSVVVVLAVAMLVTVEFLAAPGLTLSTKVKVAVAPAASVAMLAVTVPVLPTPGAVRSQPPGKVADTKVAVTGMASASDTVWASLGPL